MGEGPAKFNLERRKTMDAKLRKEVELLEETIKDREVHLKLMNSLPNQNQFEGKYVEIMISLRALLTGQAKKLTAALREARK